MILSVCLSVSMAKKLPNIYVHRELIIFVSPSADSKRAGVNLLAKVCA